MPLYWKPGRFCSHEGKRLIYLGLLNDYAGERISPPGETDRIFIIQGEDEFEHEGQKYGIRVLNKHRKLYPGSAEVVLQKAVSQCGPLKPSAHLHVPLTQLSPRVAVRL